MTVCDCVCVCRVHIRRTDKLNKEASFHSIEEYMTQVSYVIYDNVLPYL